MADDMYLRIGGLSHEIQNEAAQISESTTSIPPETTGGISDSPDSVEASPDINLFSEVFQPAQLAEAPSQSAEAPLIDAEASPFSSERLSELLVPTRYVPAKVSWDTILQIKQELMKDNPDLQSIFQSLQGLSLKDRIATLAEMQKDGTLNSFIQQLPPQAHQQLADFLVPLAQSQQTERNDQLPVVLGAIFKSMNDGKGTFADTVRAMCQKVMPYRTFEAADQMAQILNDDPAPEHRLMNLIMARSLESRSLPPGTLSYKNTPAQLDGMISSYMQNFLDGTASIPPPGLSEALRFDPAWAKSELIQISKNGSMNQFVSRLLQSGENMEAIGTAIGRSLAPISSYPSDPANRACEQFLQELMNQKSPTADDFVRALITGVKDSGYKWSGLPPSILGDMKLILQNGDDTQLNAPVLYDVNLAYDVAKSR
jgi:hypothetical protein